MGLSPSSRGREKPIYRSVHRGLWLLRTTPRGRRATGEDRLPPFNEEVTDEGTCVSRPRKKAWEDVADPVIIDGTDAIVRVEATTICGTDLHILKGDVPAVTDGRILGHEAVGTVVAVGDGIRRVKVGDRVLVSCITSCGTCQYCRDGHAGQCLGGGGWILGHKIDGTQAELVRVPFADLSTYPIPGRRQRRGGVDAGRHPADRLRGRRAQRARPPWRRRRRRRRRPDRAGGDHRVAAVQPDDGHGDRSRRQPVWRPPSRSVPT